MQFKYLLNSSAILMGALSFGFSVPAFAQDMNPENEMSDDINSTASEQSQPVNPNAAASTANTVLDDIIVTAQRRSSTVRDVPFSIVAYSGEKLQEQLIFSPADLSSQVPGVTINTADKSLSILSIRGNVSTFRTATLDTPVAFFVDDLYYVYNNDLNSNFYDVNRVEVLRGPQGTLFGRNVVGGGIAVVTNNPEYDDNYSAQLTGGNGGYFRTEGVINGELVEDKLAARVAFSTERSDGLIDTPNQRGNYGEVDSHAVRGKVLYEPTNNLKLNLSADYSYSSGNGGAIQLGIGGPEVIPNSYGDFTNDDWVNNDFQPSPYSQRLRGGLLRADWDIAGGVVTAISGYRMNDSYAFNNDIPVGTEVPVFGRAQDVKNRSFSQEVRFASAPNRLSYVLGAYYLSADVSTTNTFSYSPLASSPVGGAVTANPGISNITRVQDGDVKSYAVFGEFNFDVTDRLTLVAGGRYTKDEKNIDYRAFSTTDPDGLPVFGFPGEVNESGGESWDAFTPRATIKYRAFDNINLYATYARGFKSGGFVDNAYANPTLPLDPETSDNYEAGIKSRLLDNRLDLNLTVFRQETKNLQNFSGAGGIAHTFNGTLLMKGVEVESVIRPTDKTTINLNYAHLDGVYTDLFDPLVNQDFSGNPAKYAPSHAFNISGEHRFNLDSGATITPRAEFIYNSKISTDDADTLPTYANLYNDTEGKTLNGNLTYSPSDDRWSIGIWAKNITNNYQIVHADDITAFLSPRTDTTQWKIFTNTPRSYGITLSFKG